MFNLFSTKEKMALGSFVRMVAGVLLKNNPVDLSVVNKDRDLTEAEENKIQEEIVYFRFVLLAFFLINKSKFGKKVFSSEEISEIIILASNLAYKDNGVSDGETMKKTEILKDRIERYINFLDNEKEEEIEDKGIYFHLCRCFAIIILGDDATKFKDEEFRNKNFVVFDIAKQTYRNSEEGFENMIKYVEFID